MLKFQELDLAFDDAELYNCDCLQCCHYVLNSNTKGPILIASGRVPKNNHHFQFLRIYPSTIIKFDISD